MLESQADLDRLQALLDASHASAGPQLKRIFDTSRASASDIAGRLTGIFEIHLAALTGTGAPVVSPIDALFIKGRVWFSLSGQSVRAKLIANDPRVSASYTDGEFALVVHGTATPFTDSDAHFAEVEAHVTSTYVDRYGEVWRQWRTHIEREQGPGYSSWIEPRALFAKH